jgi:hypothetical protein
METRSPYIETSEYQKFKTVWKGLQITIRYNPNWFVGKDDFITQHIEVKSADRIPLPITKTGYRSIFLNGKQALDEFDNDPIMYVMTWMEAAAKEKQWLDQQQMSLF